MKKFTATMMLLLFFAVSFAKDAPSVVHNPANDTMTAKVKEGTPVGCTCLFHQIEEYVKALFN